MGAGAQLCAKDQNLGPANRVNQGQGKTDPEMARPGLLTGDDSGDTGMNHCVTLILQSHEHLRCALSVPLYLPRPASCFGKRSSNFLRSWGPMGGGRKELSGGAILKGRREAVGNKAGW